MMKKYRSKVDIIKAIQFKKDKYPLEMPHCIVRTYPDASNARNKAEPNFHIVYNDGEIEEVNEDDYIIKNSLGDWFVGKPSWFKKWYKEINDKEEDMLMEVFDIAKIYRMFQCKENEKELFDAIDKVIDYRKKQKLPTK